ncbi:uroporphyrinogen-III synthase [Sphingopyxis sp. JAI128]|uniref:uroporphyrinogen-III synthase n=1 Tax=Sphingopyxis sp. JAI128 TaxID=2723066 RepID=UPI0016165F4F|nr:uroporphyrinogen-III synthase [Sphingopyxis sp. JAI128]MBB6426358.1 uroporphyrinogen-III synthase [Sphingopyxis sp. JAI128]
MRTGAPLIVTRPEPGNGATVARARAMGFDARSLPLFAARPLDWTIPAASEFDALLLTSASAPRLAGPALASLASLPVHAVGAATANAADAAGLTVDKVGAADAQQLLDDMASRNIRRILWLCGRDRSEFDARTAAITPLPCYAVDRIAPPAEWAQLIAGPAVLLAHSVRAAAYVSELAGAARDHLALVAISAKVAAAAGDGWGDLVIAGQPDDGAMLAQAHALWHKVPK